MKKCFVLLTLALALFCTISMAGLQDGLLVYYALDENNGNTASDNSGNNHDAEIIGDATWASDSGQIGGAIMLDGNGGCVVDADGDAYINGLDALSVSVWIKSEATNHDRGILMGIDPDGSDNILGLRYDKSSFATAGGVDVIKASLTTTGGVQAYESKSNVQTTEWQHLVISWESGMQLALYINGTLDVTPTHNSNATDGQVSGVEKIIIGKGGKDNNGTSWHGLIDEFSLYNRVLTQDEITSLAAGGSILAVSPQTKLAIIWGELKSQ